MRPLSRFAAALCLVVPAACVPPEPVVDLSKEYTEDTVMGEIQAAGRIVIAIPDDAYPLGYVDHNDEAQGFVVELGREIADQLGVDAHFISGSSEQIVSLPQEETADVAFPALTMTESMVRKYQFSDPYYVSHQRRLIRQPPVSSSDPDANETFCAIGDPETLVTVEEVEGEVETVSSTQPGPRTIFQGPFECLRMLVDKEVAVVTGPDYLLAGLRLLEPDRTAITGEAWTTEGLGAVVEKGAAQWTEYVNGVLYFAKTEGLWLEAFEETVGRGLGLDEPIEPPDITAEEAAALYPADL